MAIYLKYEWLKTSTNIHKSQSCIVPKLFVVSTGPRVHVSWCHHLAFASFPKPVAWFFGLVNHLLHFSAASHGSNFWEQAYHWTRNLIYSQSLQQILLNYSKLQLQCEWCSLRLLARLPAKFDPTLDPNHFDAGPHLQVFAVYGAKTKSIAVLSHVFAVFQVLIVFVNKSPLTMNYDAIKQPKWRKQNMLDCCTNIQH